MKKLCFITPTMFLLLTACSKNVNQKVEDDTVKIWWYEEEGDTTYNYIMGNAIDRIISYSELNDIKIDFKKYSYTDLSYDDYVLKRNAAVSYGDVNIIFDTAANLYGLRNKAGSYEKIKNYENLFDNFKNQYCIPMCTDMRVNFINNDALKFYNIQPQNVITLDEYYELKQRMKELGAEFDLNSIEFSELVDYYCRKNNVEVMLKDGKLGINKDVALKTIHELVDDVKKNYDYEGFIKRTEESDVSDNEYKIIDKKSGYDFSGAMHYYSALNYIEYSKNIFYLPSIANFTMVILDNNMYNNYCFSNCIIPCAFIPENNKNNNAYSIVDALLSDGFQTSLYDRGNTGVITNSKKTREPIGFDENWNYVGVKYLTDVSGNKVATKIYPKNEEEKLYEVLTKGYEIIRSRDMSDFFTDNEFYWTLNEFIWCMTIDAIKDNKTFDEFDKAADDMIMNLNIRNNN